MHKSQTIKVGLLGWPVAHSFSPVIHQAAFDFQQLPWRYELLPVEPAQFSHGIRQILDSDIRGFNITAPYKEKIVEYLDDCDDSCRLIKAVNTGSHTANGKWIGSNTDVIGLLKAFECTGLFTKPLKKITILGNGGAAKAVLVALNELKISQIELLARDQNRSELLLDLFAGRFSKDKDVMARPLTPISLPEALQDTDLLINATPVGMAHSVQKTFFTEGIQIPKKLNYIDLIYQPSITPMMAQVRAAGGKAWNGLEMLINQAAASYQIWTGMHAPIDIMKAAVLRRMNE